MDYVKFSNLHFDRYRKECDTVFFDIDTQNWMPSFPELEAFCKKLYLDMVEKFKELEQTQEYRLSGEVLIATGRSTKRTLAFCIGGGKCVESTSTHGIGWELEKLFRDYKSSPEPFDLRFLSVGYRTIQRGLLPVNELYRAFGIETLTIQ